MNEFLSDSNKDFSYRQVLILLVLAFVQLNLSAGTIEIPSHIEASDELREYFEKTYRFSHVNMDSCDYYSGLLLKQAEQENNQWSKVAAWAMRSSYLVNTHQLEKAQELIEQAIQESHVINEPFLLSITYNIRGLYSHAINDTEALINDFISALQYSEEANNLARVGIMATNLGYIHLIDNNLSEAEEYFLRAQSIADSTNDVRLQASVAGSLGQLYAQKGLTHQAIEHYNSALSLSREYGDVYNEAFTHLVLGKLYMNKEIYDGAKSSFKKSISIFEEMGNVERRIEAYLNLIKTYNNTKEYQNAITYANRAVSLVDDYESSDFKMQYYEALSDTYAGLGDYKTAYTNYRKHKMWADTVYSADKAAKVLELDTRYKLEKKDLNIELLNKQQAESQAQLKQRSLTNMIALLMLLVISIALYSTWRGYNNKKMYSDTLEQEVQNRTQDLERTNHRLLNSNEELERFAYITSHDLKEPLRNINSFTTLAEMSLDEVNIEKTQSNLQVVKNSSRQMYELINAVLDYSKLKTEIKLQPIDLNETLKDVESSIANIVQEKNASISAEPLPSITGNKFQYFQLLQNLIENGIKYNERSNPVVELRCIEHDDHYDLKVTDNGIGIDAKYHDQIFTMFKRLHTKSEYFGTGLGLATVKKIVDNLGGSIKIESELGSGSTFVISIPKNTDPTNISDSNLTTIEQMSEMT